MRYMDTKEQLEAERDEHRDLRIKSAKLRQDFATVQRDNAAPLQDNATLRYYYYSLYKDLSTQFQNFQDAQRQNEAARRKEEAARCEEEAAYREEEAARCEEEAACCEEEAARCEEEAARCEEEERVMSVVLDWETRSRIVQGLNDLWAYDGTIIENYTVLKNGGFTYLPHILAIWAVKKGREPAQSLFHTLDSKDVIRMQRKADLLENQGLDTNIDQIWTSIPVVDRNTMIKLYLSTRSHPRTSIAHPSPSMSIGKYVIASDSQLSVQEKVRACEIIENAVDSEALPLFSE